MKFFLLSLILNVHPFHVSVSEIVFNEKRQALQISCRLFLDDLEAGLRTSSGFSSLDIVQDSLIAHEATEKYFKENFRLEVNGQYTPYQYLGGEIEADAIWCYLEIEAVTRVNQIRLTNTLLTGMYDDQKNMVHFRVGNDKRSFILTKDKTKATYP